MSLSVLSFFTGAPMQDLRRYVSIVYLATGAALLWLFMKVFAEIFALVGPGTDRVIFAGIQASAVIGFALAIAITGWLWKKPSVYQWVTDVCDQFSKVTWPTADETRRSSVTVIVFCIILGCILAVMDFAGKQAIDFVFKIFT